MSFDPETGRVGYPNLRNPSMFAKVYRDAGMEPPWERVYRDGVDVTDRPELWPVLWTDPKKLRRRKR